MVSVSWHCMEGSLHSGFVEKQQQGRDTLPPPHIWVPMHQSCDAACTQQEPAARVFLFRAQASGPCEDFFARTRVHCCKRAPSMVWKCVPWQLFPELERPRGQGTERNGVWISKMHFSQAFLRVGKEFSGLWTMRIALACDANSAAVYFFSFV